MNEKTPAETVIKEMIIIIIIIIIHNSESVFGFGRTVLVTSVVSVKTPTVFTRV